VAYFTGGTVGAGHVVRGLALQNALSRRGFRGKYRMFGPPTPFARGPFTAVPVDARELVHPDRARKSDLGRALLAYKPELLVVDLFWAPLRHLLPLPACEAWLLLRKVPPVWFVGTKGARFDSSQYKRIVAIEPVQHETLLERVDPMVVCNPDECEPPEALRRELGVPAEQHLVVVAHAGELGEIESLRADGATVCDLRQRDALFPLARWLSGADEIVCGAGYNAFWEARWLGYFPRARFTPFPRHIDDQAWRLHACSQVQMRSNGADTLARDIR
jgi:hypothetical protein